MPSVEIIIYSYELEAYEKAAEETCVSLEKIGNTQTYFTVNYQHASELITFGSMVEKCKRTLFREPLNSLMYDAGL